jgi:hypothetical protein
MKKLSSKFLFLFLALSVTSCAGLCKSQETEYGLLKTAATFSVDKIVGEFGHQIPDTLDEGMFLQVVHGKIPEKYYEELTKHFLVILPKGRYYLLKVYDKSTYALVLFDYSCTPEVDGRVVEEPEKYDINHLELYDPCK